jgi:hypothetical protein
MIVGGDVFFEHAHNGRHGMHANSKIRFVRRGNSNARKSWLKEKLRHGREILRGRSRSAA